MGLLSQGMGGQQPQAQPQAPTQMAGRFPRGAAVLTYERGMNRPHGDPGHVIGLPENGAYPILRENGNVDMVPIDQVRAGG